MIFQWFHFLVSGFGYGFGALNAVGNDIRDFRQEGEIQRERAELDAAKQREAELAARIAQLEQSQGINSAPVPVQQ